MHMVNKINGKTKEADEIMLEKDGRWEWRDERNSFFSPIFSDGLCASNNCKRPEGLECYATGNNGLWGSAQTLCTV
jgi:hypothetical protein